MNTKANDIVNKAIQESCSTNKVKDTICNDLFIGRITYKKKWMWQDLDDELAVYISDNNINKIKKQTTDEYVLNNTNENRIVVVLESPHTSEYDLQGKSKGPARGKTGNLFVKYFCELLSNVKLDQNCIYDIILINSIRLQCSLGYNPEFFRDLVWLYYWKDKLIRENLIDRIKELEPDFIINLSTKGSHKHLNNGFNKEFNKKFLQLVGCDSLINLTDNTLQGLVHEELQLFSNLLKGNYPSSWYAKNNRKDFY